MEDKHGVLPAQAKKEIKNQELGLWLEQPDLSLADRNIGLKCFKFFGDKNVYSLGKWKDNNTEKLRNLRKDFKVKPKSKDLLKKKKIQKENPQKMHVDDEETASEGHVSLVEAEMITSEESSEINDDSSVSSKQENECQIEAQAPLKMKISLTKNKVIKTSPLKTPKQRKMSTEKVSLSLDFVAQTKKNTPQRSRLNLILDNLREKKTKKGSSDEKGEGSSTDTDSSIIESTCRIDADMGRKELDDSDQDNEKDKQTPLKSDHDKEKKGKGKAVASGSGKGKEKLNEEGKEKVVASVIDEGKEKDAVVNSPVFQCLMCEEKVTLKKDCVTGHLKLHKVTLDDYSKIFVSHRKDEDMQIVRNWVDEKGQEDDETEKIDDVKEDEEKVKPETTRTKFWRKQKEEAAVKAVKQHPCTKCNKVMTSVLAYRNHQKVHNATTKRSSRRSTAQEDEETSETDDKSDVVDTEDIVTKDQEALLESVNKEYQHKKLRLLNASVAVSLDERTIADQELEDASSVDSADPDSADPDSRPATPDHDYKCVHCGEGFKAAYLLNVHYRTKHFEKIHKCPQCPKTYFSVPELEQHELIHKMQGGGVVKDPGTSHRPGGRPSLDLYSLPGTSSPKSSGSSKNKVGKSKKEESENKEDSDASKTDQTSSEEAGKDKAQQKQNKDCDTTSDADVSLTSKLRKLRKVTSSSKLLSHPVAAMITPITGVVTETQPPKSPEPSKSPVAVPESTSDMSVELEHGAKNDDSTKQAAAMMEEETSFPLSSTVADSIKDIGAKETVSEVPDSTTTVDEVSSADCEKSKSPSDEKPSSSSAFEANYLQFVKTGKPLAFEANYLQFLNAPQTPSWCSPSQSDYKTCSSPEQNSSEYKSCSSSENNSVSGTGGDSTLHTPPCSTTTQEAPIGDLQDLSVSSKPALKRPYTCQDCDGY